MFTACFGPAMFVENRLLATCKIGITPPNCLNNRISMNHREQIEELKERGRDYQDALVNAMASYSIGRNPTKESDEVLQNLLSIYELIGKLSK